MNIWWKNLFFFAIWACIHSTLINNNIERTLDLSSQLVKETIKISAEDSNKQPFREYSIVLSDEETKNLAYLSARNELKEDIKVRRKNIDNQIWFIFLLPSASAYQTLNLELIYIKSITAYPDEVKQHESQLVKYLGRLFLYSPYVTKSQKVTLKHSGNAVSWTQVRPFTEAHNKITFGPYENVPVFSNQSLVIHYENHSPFLTVNRLERTMEISHWGNVAIRESVYMSHTGARLKGPFSRYDFQKDGKSGQTAVKSYKTILPASATQVFYRDSNGNISTSNMKVLRDAVELELRPRFPLFGGWKTHYFLGYNMPSYEYLFNDKDLYILQMRLIDHIYDDMVIEKALIKVILPEGSSNIKTSFPYPVLRHADELFYTYLDTIGRPVIVFSKSNLIENHIAEFQVQYKFTKACLFQEPLLTISFIFGIFLITIISLRVDCKINVHSHKE